jgi:hypothetical protein
MHVPGTKDEGRRTKRHAPSPFENEVRATSIQEREEEVEKVRAKRAPGTKDEGRGTKDQGIIFENPMPRRFPPRLPGGPRWVAAGAVALLAWTTIVLAAPRTDAQRYVTVIDADGRPVLGLSHEDFALKDGGVRRPIVSVEPATAPISAVVVVRGFAAADANEIAKAIDALKAVRASTPGSPALQVTMASSETQDTSTIPAAIDEAARSQVSDGFDRRMVLSIVRRGGQEDGLDAEAANDVVDALTDAKAALWTLEVDPAGGKAATASPLEKLLATATDASGSVRTHVKSTADLPSAAQDLFYLWRGQYLVTYMWPDPMLSFFKLEVRHDRGVVLTTGWER